MHFAIIAVLVATTLGGCATMGRDNQREADVACRAIGASLSALAPNRKKLGLRAEATVQTIRERAAPLCDAPNPPRTADVARELVAMAADLLTVEKGI